MAHIISIYKLNQAENQDDKSKMLQIFKLQIDQLRKLGAKFYATKTSPRLPSEKNRLKSSESDSLS